MAADDIAHLLRRTEFSAKPNRVAQLGGGTIADAVNDIVEFAANANPQIPPELVNHDGNNAFNQQVAAYEWWLDSMAARPRPFQEKMALFWHGHFTSEWDVVGRTDHMMSQNQLYRTQSLGNFETLTQQMSLQPAMLLYLSNSNNVKSAPNENFARELMELFTLGVGNYAESDVAAAARAWTGYNYDGTTHQYEFRSTRHDNDPKTFFGVTKNWDGPAIIHEILVDNPAKQLIAARFIVRKLWEFLAYLKPAQNIVDELAAVFIGANLELKPTLVALLNRPEFYSFEAKQGLVRTPTEWAVAILNGTGLPAKAIGLYGYADRMGQVVFNPPNVSGWKNNNAWLTTSAISGRAAVAKKAASLWAGYGTNADMVINMSSAGAVDFVASMFGLAPLSPSTYNAVLSAHQQERGASNNAKSTVAGLLALVMLTGEMNVG